AIGLAGNGKQQPAERNVQDRARWVRLVRNDIELHQAERILHAIPPGQHAAEEGQARHQAECGEAKRQQERGGASRLYPVGPKRCKAHAATAMPAYAASSGASGSPSCMAPSQGTAAMPAFVTTRGITAGMPLRPRMAPVASPSFLVLATGGRDDSH